MAKKLLMRVLVLFVAVYMSVIGYIYFNQVTLLYGATKDIKELSEYNIPGMQEFFLTTSDGVKIQTWFRHSSVADMPYVIFLHGKFRHLEERVDKFKILADLGYGIIAPSWRGFGKSEGVPSEEGLYNDARAAIEYAKTLNLPTESLLLIGESLGSGIACKMAEEHNFKGLFLITPYTTIADRAQEIYWYLPVKYLVKDNFNNIDRLPKLHLPLLIVHGNNDIIIPHHHSEDLIKVANEPKKLIMYPGKGHNNLEDRKMFMDMTEYFGVNTKPDAL